MSTNIPVIGVVEKKHSRINYEHGILYYEDNLYFKKDKSCWAAYKIISYTYAFKNERSKMLIHNKLTRLFWNIAEEFHLIDIPIETSLKEQQEQLKKKSKGNLKFEAIKEIDETTKILTQDFGDKGNIYETYIIVKFKKPQNFFRTLKEFSQSIIQEPIRLLNRISGLEPFEIYKREYEIYKQMDEIAFSKMQKQLSMVRANEYEIQKLIKYLFYYGIGMPPLIGSKPTNKRRSNQNLWKPKADIILKNKKEYIRPRERELLKLTECDINIKHPRRICIRQHYKGKERAAYQAYLAISDLPDSLPVGGEWHYYLKESLDFPIYTSIRGKIVENKIAKDELNRKKREIDDQEEHIRNAEGVSIPIDILEKIDDAMILDNEIKSKKFPLIYTTMIIVVAADNIEKLEKRIDAVKAALDPITIECPAGDQWLMMNEAMIGGEQFQKDYLLRLPPDHLALITPGATMDVGDSSGYYIGITGSLRRPVRIGPDQPSQLNKPPNSTFTGVQGGGKSLACDMIALKAAKYLGAYVLGIDPKNERTYWGQKFNSFGDEIRIITFTADEKDNGKLDPYIIMKSNSNDDNYNEKIKEASVLALDICMFLLATDRKDPRTRILMEATKLTEIDDDPSMSKIIYYLNIQIREEALKDDDVIKANMAKEMASTLNSYKKMAFAGLLFGEGYEEAINFEKQINIMQIQNLVFPEKDKNPNDFTYQEIIGYACLLGITGYIKKFILGDRSKLKIFVLDESNVIRSTPAGKNTMNSLHRMARALNSPGYFIGQSTDDIGDEKIKNNIGYKFAFRTEDIQEIKKVLKYFKLEETEENIEMISSLETGMCLFQDHQGRTAVISIDCVFEEYLEGLNTTPPVEASGGE